MKTVTITEKGQIAIPEEIRSQSGFKKGEKMVMLSFEDHIELRPLSQINKVIKKIPFTALMSERSLAKVWNTPKEDKAWKNL